MAVVCWPVLLTDLHLIVIFYSQVTHQLDSIAQNYNKISIRLTNLTLNSSGQYRCEVSTGAPFYHTNFKQKNMTVICELLEKLFFGLLLACVISFMKNSCYDSSKKIKGFCINLNLKFKLFTCRKKKRYEKTTKFSWNKKNHKNNHWIVEYY